MAFGFFSEELFILGFILFPLYDQLESQERKWGNVSISISSL